MPTFKYIAYTTTGTKKIGIIEADAKEKAILLLKNKGLYPESIDQVEKKQAGLLKKLWNKYFCRISQTQRAELFFRLATLLESGIPLVEALNIVANQYKNPIKEVLLAIKDKVNEGGKFSDALKQYPNIFYPIYINMISIAEKTGNLSQILSQIASYEEEKENLSHKIISTLIYPFFVLCLGGAVVSFLLVYVVPKMQKIFASLHKELPLVTKMLIWIGNFFNNYFGILILFGIGFISILQIFYSKISFTRKLIDDFLLRFDIYKKLIMAKFSSVLSFQLKAGMPFIEAIFHAKGVVKNKVFQQAVDKAIKDIKEGAFIDNAFKEIPFFDSMFIASLNIGKKSGKIDDFISRISVYYEKEINRQLKRIVDLAEPVSILILGIIVGFIVMAIMVPLFDLNQLIK